MRKRSMQPLIVASLLLGNQPIVQPELTTRLFIVSVPTTISYQLLAAHTTIFSSRCLSDSF